MTKLTYETAAEGGNNKFNWDSLEAGEYKLENGYVVRIDDAAANARLAEDKFIASLQALLESTP